MNCAVELASQHKTGLALKNPLMIASGFGGYGLELSRMYDISRLGAIVTAPVSLHPWPGSSQPRLKEVAAGYLLHTGDQNPGLRQVLRQYAKAWASWDTAVIVRLAGASADEYATLAARLENVEGVAGLELKLTQAGKGQEEIAAAQELLRAVRQATALPLLAVLPLPVAGGLPEAAVEAGADALVVAAPTQGTLLITQERAPFTGELYGAGLLPLSLHELHRIAQRVSAPLIGRGGIHSADDALAYLLAGASAVQVDSAILRQPTAPWDIREELERWMLAQGIADIAELIGGALPSAPPISPG